MVISKNYNFLFTRIPKNASSSLAAYFIQNYCDKSDIYTAVNDSNIKNNNVPSHVLIKHKQFYRFIHLTVQEIIDEGAISKEQAINMQKIAVIRCPLQRQLSLYFFLKRSKPKSPEEFRELFSEGYHKLDGNSRIKQIDYLKIDGQIAPNTSFWLYDNLTNHLNKFKQEKGISETVALPNHKSKYKPKDQNLIDIYYDEKTRNAVINYYNEDYLMYESLYTQNK